MKRRTSFSPSASSTAAPVKTGYGRGFGKRLSHRRPCLGSQGATAAAALWLVAATQTAAAGLPEDPFEPCYPKGRPIECGLVDQLITQCVVAEERYRHQEKVTRRCEAILIGRRHAQAELISDAKARQAALDEVAILSDRLARSAGVEYNPNGTGLIGPSGFAHAATGAQSGPGIYSSSVCVGAIVNAQCHGEVEPASSYRLTCHGEVVDGVCTGPIF